MDLLYRVKTLWAALRGNHYTWPAIDITLPGNRHFHLIGSIHMGSHDMAPLPTRLLKKLKNADALIVEADVSTSDTPFANLPACEALEERISEEQLQNLQHISQEMGISPSLFSTQPLWQIAMVLQATQAQKLGLRAEYGIDYQLLQAAKQQHKPVIELEGAENQIAMLLQLPDKGLALLDDTLTHWHTNARLLQQMMSWWLNAPPQNNDITLPNMWSRSVHYTCMEKGICRRCCAKKMANIAIGPSKRNFIFLLLCRHFKRRCNSIVAQSHHPANTLRQDDSFFWTAIRRMLASFFCLRQENYHDTRS